MKSLFIVLLFSFSLTLVYANNPNSTHAEISISGETLSVSIEVPWSISKAVANYRKGLIQQDPSISFKQHLRAYINQNFMLIQKMNTLQATSFSFSDKDDGKSAIVRLEFKVKRGEQLSIQNTLLFNINNKQKNHHKVSWEDGEEYKYITEKNKFNFVIEKC